MLISGFALRFVRYVEGHLYRLSSIFCADCHDLLSNAHSHDILTLHPFNSPSQAITWAVKDQLVQAYERY